MAIDIVPLLFPNIVFPRSRLPVPVAIPKTTAFDPSTVVISSLRFGATGTEVSPLHWKLIDIDRDGDRDLVLLFPIVGSGVVCGATSAKLTAQTNVGWWLDRRQRRHKHGGMPVTSNASAKPGAT